MASGGSLCIKTDNYFVVVGMIHYSQEDLVVIEFTDQGPSIRKESSPRL